jgi:hypothetical protein
MPSIIVQDEYVECRNGDQLAWRIPIAAMLLIGEYTNDEGPQRDDYFIDFWSLEEDTFYHSKVTFYAAGRDAAFVALAKHLETDLTFGLTGSTEWASRIMWPPELAGHPYLSTRELKPSTWREKLFYRCFGATLEYFPAEEIQAYLKQAKSSR